MYVMGAVQRNVTNVRSMFTQEIIQLLPLKRGES